MSGSGFVYFGRTYAATVSGSALKRVQCAACNKVFEYILERSASGRGASHYFLNNAGAAERARQRAHVNLDRALSDGVDPVHCPECGIYQPEMVQVLRKKLGKTLDPNIFAKLRLAISPQEAWLAVCKENTVRSYTNFMMTWPTYSAEAKRKISELKYPPHVRRLGTRLAWTVWGGSILLVFYFIIAGSMH
jgi:hypothetical protein